MNESQRQAAEKYIKKLNTEKIFVRPIVTEIAPFAKFHEAEEEHQDYFRHHPDKPYCQLVISPKLAKLRKEFAPLLKPA